MLDAAKLCVDCPTIAYLTVFDCDPGLVSMPYFQCPKSFPTTHPFSSRMPLAVKPAIAVARSIADLVSVERPPVGREADNVAFGESDRFLTISLKL